MEEQKPVVKETDYTGIYYGGAILTGILVFIGVWIYAMSEWGFLWGVMFGWIPGLIAGFIGGVIWPLLALGVGWLVLQSL